MLSNVKYLKIHVTSIYLTEAMQETLHRCISLNITRQLNLSAVVSAAHAAS